MKAKDEIALLQAKLADGRLDPEEPLFTLRAQDVLAAGVVNIWASLAKDAGAPAAKCQEAKRLAVAMQEWPIKQVPGRPGTREVRNTEPKP